jgi:cytochrome c556
MRSRLAAAAAALGLSLTWTPGLATAADDKAVIDYRQDLMEGIGANMAAISDILKNGLPYQANIETHAANIERSADLIPSAFKQRVVEGPTDAKPDIWKDPERFRKAAEAMQAEAAKLVAAARDGNPEKVGPQVKALGKACGECHKPFRKPKEESYHRHEH